MTGHLHYWNTRQALRLQLKSIRQVTLRVSGKTYFLHVVSIIVNLIWVQRSKKLVIFTDRRLSCYQILKLSMFRWCHCLYMLLEVTFKTNDQTDIVKWTFLTWISFGSIDKIWLVKNGLHCMFDSKPKLTWRQSTKGFKTY